MRKGEPVIQVYYLNGRLVLRSATKNANEPSEAQKEMRERFKTVAQKGRGTKMTGNIPPTAEIVASELKGVKSSKSKKKKRVWEKDIDEYVAESRSTEEKANEVIKRLML